MLSIKEKEKIREILEGLDKESLKSTEKLIPAYHEIQKSYNNSIPEDVLKEISEQLKIPSSKAYEVLSFYTLFSKNPRGKYVVRVCENLPCHVVGGNGVIEELKSTLKINFNQTTPDNLFTLETTSCLGLCGVGPVIMINEEAYGNLTEEKVRNIISKITEGERK